jgi:lipid-binding SYLF domain-containing protein
MNTTAKILISLLLTTATALTGCQSTGSKPSESASGKPTAAAAEIDRDAASALNKLYESTPAAKVLGAKAKGILIFPDIVKGGLGVGAQYGKGALLKAGRTAGYYETVAASYGLQAGLQKFGYALFFMDDAALSYLDRSGGWEVGVGPSIVVVDQGRAGALTTTTARDEVYAFFFDQRGLMAGLGLQGSKISKISP